MSLVLSVVDDHCSEYHLLQVNESIDSDDFILDFLLQFLIELTDESCIISFHIHCNMLKADQISCCEDLLSQIVQLSFRCTFLVNVFKYSS